MDHPGLEASERGGAGEAHLAPVIARFEALRGATGGHARAPGDGSGPVGWFRWAALLALALAAVGCQRKTTLIAEQPDSARVAAVDSLTIHIREMQQAWEGAVDDAAAAHRTAQVLREDLARRPPAEWRGRAESLLDSLGIGVESAGGGCGMILNLFLRADPSRGSWPMLFWCDSKGARVQEIEGKGLRLVDMARRAAGGLDAVAGLFYRARGGRQEPILNVWTQGPAGAGWRISQTLGPDSLGGSGTAEFTATADTSIDLVARTYRTPPRFEECITCPHVYGIQRFHWGPSGFERVESRFVASTYATFVRFITALQTLSENPAVWVANPALLDQARTLDWDRSRGTWRVAPGSEDAGAELTFFRGTQEAYRVRFEPRGDDYVISSIEVAPRAVE